MSKVLAAKPSTTLGDLTAAFQSDATWQGFKDRYKQKIHILKVYKDRFLSAEKKVKALPANPSPDAVTEVITDTQELIEMRLEKDVPSAVNLRKCSKHN